MICDVILKVMVSEKVFRGVPLPVITIIVFLCAKGMNVNMQYQVEHMVFIDAPAL